MCCSKSICCQLFCFPYYGYRMTEVIQRLHAVDIHPYTFLSKELCQLRITSSALMSWYIKWYYPHSSESFQSFMYGCMILVQLKTTSFHHSSISSFLCFNPQSAISQTEQKNADKGTKPQTCVLICMYLFYFQHKKDNILFWEK